MPSNYSKHHHNDTESALLSDYIAAAFPADRKRLTPLLADNAVYHCPPFSRVGPVTGKQNIVNFLCGAAEMMYQTGTLSYSILAIGNSDSQGAAILQISATTASNRAYYNTYGIGVRIEQDLIVEVWELLDTTIFLDTFDDIREEMLQRVQRV